jgi:hypothetical protein
MILETHGFHFWHSDRPLVGIFFMLKRGKHGARTWTLDQTADTVIIDVQEPEVYDNEDNPQTNDLQTVQK